MEKGSGGQWLNVSQQCALAAGKVNSLPGSMSRSMSSRSNEVILHLSTQHLEEFSCTKDSLKENQFSFNQNQDVLMFCC